MKAELTLIPKLTIHPDKICAWNEINWSPEKPRKENLCLADGTKVSQADRIKDSSRSANGLVSKNAHRKISKAIDYLLLMASPQTGYIPKSGKKFSFRIAFVTFVLPSKQIHTDNEIKRMLWNSMLIELTRFHGVKNYLWRAEKQKNGNLHFHLIIDKFVKYDELRKRWNRITNKLGYVDRYRERQKEYHKNGFQVRNELLKNWPEDKQKKAWLEGVKSNWSSPNSTDIHSVKYISNLKNYVQKYMTKNENDDKLGNVKDLGVLSQGGRIWGCNEMLSDIKGARLEVDNEIEKALTDVINKTGCRRFQDTYFSVYYIDMRQLQENSPDLLFKYFSQYLLTRFNYSNQLVL
jgi:hypothetical protein